MRKLVLPVAMMFIYCTSVASDITIWFGHPDGSPLIFRVGSEEVVPVWLANNPDVYAAAVHIPLSSDDIFIVERTGIKVFAPFKNEDVPEGFDHGWDVVDIFEPNPHQGRDGFTSQGLLAFMNLMKKPNLPLHCQDTCKIMEYKLRTAGNDSLRGKFFDVFVEGFQDRSRGLHFSDTLGARTFDYDAYFSRIYFVFPGDIDNDLKITADDLDALRLYIDGSSEIPWPEERADFNDDGVINNADLTLLEQHILNQK